MKKSKKLSKEDVLRNFYNADNQNPLNIFRAEIDKSIQNSDDVLHAIGQAIEGKYDLLRIKNFVDELLNGKLKTKFTPEVLKIINDAISHFYAQEELIRSDTERDAVWDTIGKFQQKYSEQWQKVKSPYNFNKNLNLVRVMYFLFRNEALPEDANQLDSIKQAFSKIDISKAYFPHPVFKDSGEFDINGTENNPKSNDLDLIQALHSAGKINQENLLFLYSRGFNFDSEKHRAILPNHIQENQELMNLLFDKSYKNTEELIDLLNKLKAIKFFDGGELRKLIIKNFPEDQIGTLTEAIEASNYIVVQEFRSAMFLDYESKLNDDVKRKEFFKLLNVINKKLSEIISRKYIGEADRYLYAELLPILEGWMKYENLPLSRKQEIGILLESCNYAFNPHTHIKDRRQSTFKTPTNQEAGDIVKIIIKPSNNSLQDILKTGSEPYAPPHIELHNYLKGKDLDLNANIFQNANPSALDQYDVLKCLLIHYPFMIKPKILSVLLDNGLEIVPEHIYLAEQKKSDINSDALDMLFYQKDSRFLIEKIKEAVIFHNENNTHQLFNLIADNINIIKNSKEHWDHLLLSMIKHQADPNYIRFLLENGIKPLKKETLPLIAIYRQNYQEKFSDQRDIDALFTDLGIKDLKASEIREKFENEDYKDNGAHSILYITFLRSQKILDPKSPIGEVETNKIIEILTSDSYKLLPLSDSFASLFSYAITHNHPVFVRAVVKWIAESNPPLNLQDKNKLKTAITDAIPTFFSEMLKLDSADKSQKQQLDARLDISTRIYTSMFEMLGFTEDEMITYSEQLNHGRIISENTRIFRKFLDEIKKGSEADQGLIRELLSRTTNRATQTTVEAEFAKDFGTHTCLFDFLLKYKFSPNLIKTVLDYIEPKISTENALDYEENYKKFGSKYLLEFYDLIESERFKGDKAEIKKLKKELQKDTAEQSILHQLATLSANFLDNSDDEYIRNDLSNLTQTSREELFQDDDRKRDYKTRLENLLVLSASKPSQILFDIVSEVYKEKFTQSDLESTTKDILQAYILNKNNVNPSNLDNHIQFINKISSVNDEVFKKPSENLIKKMREKFASKDDAKQSDKPTTAPKAKGGFASALTGLMSKNK